MCKNAFHFIMREYVWAFPEDLQEVLIYDSFEGGVMDPK